MSFLLHACVHRDIFGGMADREEHSYHRQSPKGGAHQLGRMLEDIPTGLPHTLFIKERRSQLWKWNCRLVCDDICHRQLGGKPDVGSTSHATVRGSSGRTTKEGGAFSACIPWAKPLLLLPRLLSPQN